MHHRRWRRKHSDARRRPQRHVPRRHVARRRRERHRRCNGRHDGLTCRLVALAGHLRRWYYCGDGCGPGRRLRLRAALRNGSVQPRAAQPQPPAQPQPSPQVVPPPQVSASAPTVQVNPSMAPVAPTMALTPPPGYVPPGYVPLGPPPGVPMLPPPAPMLPRRCSRPRRSQRRRLRRARTAVRMRSPRWPSACSASASRCRDACGRRDREGAIVRVTTPTGTGAGSSSRARISTRTSRPRITWSIAGIACSSSATSAPISRVRRGVSGDRDRRDRSGADIAIIRVKNVEARGSRT